MTQTFYIIATKQTENPERPARVEIYVNEFSTYFDIVSGDKSPNMSFHLGASGINLSSGIYTQNLNYNLEMSHYFTLGLAQGKNAEYFTDYLILAGWEVVFQK